MTANPDLTDLAANWRQALEAELPQAIELRHTLHAAPELSGQEEQTAILVAEAIQARPDQAKADQAKAGQAKAGQAKAGQAKAGLAGLDRGGKELPEEKVAETGRLIRVGPLDGPAVAIRSELDALPIEEQTGVSYASRNGAMHACGHDVHLAALVALVRAAQQVTLPMGLLAVLQPREESVSSGARDIVDSGRLLPHNVQAVVAAHLQPRVATSTVSADAGPVNAAFDEIRVVITGRGGHSAYPHLALNPLPALCQVVAALEDAVRRTVNPMHPVLLTMTQVSGANAPNVIPGTVTAGGTLRAMHAADLEALRPALRETVRGVAAAHGCTGEVRILHGEPSLVNDPQLVSAGQHWLTRLDAKPAARFASLGSDDFAWYRRVAPILMMFVGTGDVDGASSLHDARFLPSDSRVREVAYALLAGYLAAVDVHER